MPFLYRYVAAESAAHVAGKRGIYHVAYQLQRDDGHHAYGNTEDG